MISLLVIGAVCLYGILLMRINILEKQIKRYKLQIKTSKNKEVHENTTCADHQQNADKIFSTVENQKNE